MRIAQCIKPLRLNLLGSKSSVAISEGWRGDLDQVIGVDGKGVPVTVANALGHHLTDDNFRIEPAGDKSRPSGSNSVKPQTQE